MTGFVADSAALLLGVALDIAPIVVVLFAFQRFVVAGPYRIHEPSSSASST